MSTPSQNERRAIRLVVRSERILFTRAEEGASPCARRVMPSDSNMGRA